MPVAQIQCPACATKLGAPPGAAPGTRLRCPTCQAILQMPGATPTAKLLPTPTAKLLPTPTAKLLPTPPDSAPGRRPEPEPDGYADDDPSDDADRPRKRKKPKTKRSKEYALSDSDESFLKFGRYAFGLGLAASVMPLFGIQFKGLHLLGPASALIGVIAALVGFFLLFLVWVRNRDHGTARLHFFVAAGISVVPVVACAWFVLAAVSEAPLREPIPGAPRHFADLDPNAGRTRQDPAPTRRADPPPRTPPAVGNADGGREADPLPRDQPPGPPAAPTRDLKREFERSRAGSDLHLKMIQLNGALLAIHDPAAFRRDRAKVVRQLRDLEAARKAFAAFADLPAGGIDRILANTEQTLERQRARIEASPQLKKLLAEAEAEAKMSADD